MLRVQQRVECVCVLKGGLNECFGCYYFADFSVAAVAIDEAQLLRKNLDLAKI